MRKAAVGMALCATLIMAGCSKSSNPVSGQQQTSVNLAVSFSKAGSGLGLLKSAFAFGADSLKIDSAIVVFARIKFESHVDSIAVDTTGNDTTTVEREDEMNVTFRGPFVVHIRDTVAIDFASQTLPAGTYDGIKFKIHRLQPGEHHEDSDEHHGHMMNPLPDSTGFGSSIVVWGQVYKNGAWQPFEFKFDGELEFKISGNFVVTDATSSINIALNFNMGLWFRNVETGVLLDPTDLSPANRELLRNAIRHSFGNGRGGHDDDHDGHPDDHH